MAFQSFLPETKSIAIPVQDFDQRPSAIAERKVLSPERILAHLLLHQNRQPVDRLPLRLCARRRWGEVCRDFLAFLLRVCRDGGRPVEHSYARGTQSLHSDLRLDLWCAASTGRPLVAEGPAGLASRELPVDRRSLAVGLAVPCSGFPLQEPQIQEPSGAQTLPRVQAQFDLRLIEPASVS
jgi:hypothetical protein